MKSTILSQLQDIEKNENIQILLAVESGSRAWGFAGKDSDYDVRFIYVRKKDDYLRFDKRRDVIELPITDSLDINGWDLQKACRLLYESNPTLFEWVNSPIVYMETEFVENFRKIMNDYFNPKKSLYHYMKMAENNYRDSLKREVVKAKKYFYVLRPILACRWVLKRGTPPPVLFSQLVENELPQALLPHVKRLLNIKINSFEAQEVARIDEINEYLESSLEEIRIVLSSMEKVKTKEWEKLNRLFLGYVL